MIKALFILDTLSFSHDAESLAELTPRSRNYGRSDRDWGTAMPGLFSIMSPGGVALNTRTNWVYRP